MSTHFTATILGSPRIGPKRELKRAIEGYWAGRLDQAQLESVAADLRRQTWAELTAAGLDSVPVNTFSYYDHMLDTAVLLGALPARYASVNNDLDRYRRSSWHRRGCPAGDDEVVRHQLSLHRAGAWS